MNDACHTVETYYFVLSNVSVNKPDVNSFKDVKHLIVFGLGNASRN